MRVKELADLAETTVRTVRYYHHVGLLPVPPARGGVREYSLYHLARLLRIRWLAESGLPLAAISDVVADPGAPAPPNAADELREALASVDARIARLRRQREQLADLLESARLGRRLTPLPERVAALYDRFAALMPSEPARHALEAERSMMVFLAVHGLLPASLDDLLGELETDDEIDTVELFSGFAALATLSGSDAEATLVRLLAITASMIDRHAGAIARMAADLPQGLAGAALWSLVRRLTRVAYPAPSQQRYLDLVADQLLSDRRIFADPVLAPVEGLQ